MHGSYDGDLVSTRKAPYSFAAELRAVFGAGFYEERFTEGEADE